MATIKILLEEGETPLDADQALQKALELHTSGDIHDGQTFDDPAMLHVAQRMEQLHAKMYAEMIHEICDVLDQEYSYGSE